MDGVTIVSHPLVQHKLTLLRKKDGSTKSFRELLKEIGMLLCYEVTGTGFLRHMVRIIVGSLVEIGRGRQPVEWIGGVIAARDRTLAGPTAPPQGLFLVGIEYGGVLAAAS